MLLCQPEAATYKIATGRPVALGSVRKRRQIQPLDCKLEGVVSVGVHQTVSDKTPEVVGNGDIPGITPRNIQIQPPSHAVVKVDICPENPLVILPLGSSQNVTKWSDNG